MGTPARHTYNGKTAEHAGMLKAVLNLIAWNTDGRCAWCRAGFAIVSVLLVFRQQVGPEAVSERLCRVGQFQGPGYVDVLNLLFGVQRRIPVPRQLGFL